MPNWCSNALIVTGPKKELDDFKATLDLPDKDGEKTDFSFAQTVPPPENMFNGDLSEEDRQTCIKIGIPNWLDWQRENWGCKWDACEARVKKSVKSVKIWFDTPWAPPLAWLKNASAKFPTLNFELAYNECGMAFYGVAEATNGNLNDNGGTKYEEDDVDEDGEPQGALKEHVESYDLGMGG